MRDFSFDVQTKRLKGMTKNQLEGFAESACAYGRLLEHEHRMAQNHARRARRAIQKGNLNEAMTLLGMIEGSDEG